MSDEQDDLGLPDPGGDWAGTVDVPDEKWPAALATIVDVLADLWQRDGVPADEAIDRARRSALTIADYQGGRPLYLPRGERLQVALRDRQIYLLHRGNNVEALARRFGLTTRHIERIYAEQRAIQIARRQARLFE